MKVVLPEKYRPKRTTNNKHSENSFCVVSRAASALRLDFISAVLTQMGSSKLRAQYLSSPRLEATKSACTLLTRDTEQQLSNGKGRRSPAELMDVLRLLQFCSWDSGFAEGAGMITADKPNKGVEDEGWSEVTGAGAPEGEVKVYFEDSTCVEHDGFSDHWASTCFPDAQTRLQVTA